MRALLRLCVLMFRTFQAPDWFYLSGRFVVFLPPFTPQGSVEEPSRESMKFRLCSRARISRKTPDKRDFILSNFCTIISFPHKYFRKFRSNERVELEVNSNIESSKNSNIYLPLIINHDYSRLLDFCFINTQILESSLILKELKLARASIRTTSEQRV